MEAVYALPVFVTVTIDGALLSVSKNIQFQTDSYAQR